MKFFILALAFAFLAQPLMAQLLGGYVELSEEEINASPVINDLKNLGAAYVIQQGVFVSTKAPLPGDWYEITSTEKIEARVTPGVTYYRYTVTLTENDGHATADATYVVSWRPSNGAFLVASYQYTVTKTDSQEQSVGGPSLVDIRPLNDGTGDLFPTLVEAVRFVVHDAADRGYISGGVYTLRYVYNAYLQNSGYPPTYVFLVRLVSSSGINYRIQMTVPIEDEAYGEDHEAEYGHNEELGENENEIGEIGIGNGLKITYIIYPNS